MNIFDQPVEKETLEEWAKMMLDIAKVAILAIPAIIYKENSLAMKVFSGTALIFVSYVSLIVHRRLPKLVKEGKWT